MTAEHRRLEQDASREQHWKRWGPYLAERQWATVREDYSERGTAWEDFPHDHARSRAYRWGEDGLLGITDRQSRMCFALALWNGKDPMLKERLFGLTGPQGNHGEDVKEEYFYLDSTPTHSYMRALYKYPQGEYPYKRLVDENRRRGKQEPEFELRDTGVFDGERYFDVVAEYAKASPNDVLIRVTIANRAAEAAELHLLPTLWYRNTWSWGRTGEDYWRRPDLRADGEDGIVGDHESLGCFRLDLDRPPDGVTLEWLFTENETNAERLFGVTNSSPHVKDAFHDVVVHGRRDAANPARHGTKAAAWLRGTIPADSEIVVRLRLYQDGAGPRRQFGEGFDRTFAARIAEADAFYASLQPGELDRDERRVQRQAYAGLLWSKQFYWFDVKTWIEGDPAQPTPPPARRFGRNHQWMHLYNRDVLSMPDKWEYPWYAAWDLAFHMIPFARVDPGFAKAQCVLLLREWYMHPNGQIPAYEFAFGDVNPPVHAWVCWRVYKMTAARGARDRVFLARCFHKLLLNFTWWVNRKDSDGNHIFAGGFLGMDNIGVFDRSRPLPNGGQLEQADGTAWMAFFCSTMLAMALELADGDAAYEDIASKFFEHFVAITDAMNTLGDSGLWDEQDGFYYDKAHLNGRCETLRIRSLVGLVPLLAVEVLEEDVIARLPGFRKRMQWFLDHRTELSRHVIRVERAPRAGSTDGPRDRVLLAIASEERLRRVLRYLLDEREFLSPHGIRSLSKVHAEHPFVLHVNGDEHRVDYAPGESTTRLFGGNSNWRGPIWFPLNYLLVEALERYHHFYGDELCVEFGEGTGRTLTLREVAEDLTHRLAGIFIRDEDARRPCHGDARHFAEDPHWRDLLLFHEHFHAETGRGLGASHQTGWTALVTRCLDDVARARRRAATASSRRISPGS